MGYCVSTRSSGVFFRQHEHCDWEVLPRLSGLRWPQSVLEWPVLQTPNLCIPSDLQFPDEYLWHRTKGKNLIAFYEHSPSDIFPLSAFVDIPAAHKCHLISDVFFDWNSLRVAESYIRMRCAPLSPTTVWSHVSPPSSWTWTVTWSRTPQSRTCISPGPG